MTSGVGPPEAGGGAIDRASTLGPDGVRCAVHLTRDDYWALLRYLKRHQRTRVFWASVASYIGALAACLVAAAQGAPIAAVLAFIAAIGSLLMQKWSSDVSHLHTGRCDYTANAGSITAETEHVVTRHAWSTFASCVDTPDHFFLLAPTAAAVIVPKRGFRSAEDVDRFASLVRASIASS